MMANRQKTNDEKWKKRNSRFFPLCWLLNLNSNWLDFLLASFSRHFPSIDHLKTCFLLFLLKIISKRGAFFPRYTQPFDLLDLNWCLVECCAHRQSSISVEFQTESTRSRWLVTCWRALRQSAWSRFFTDWGSLCVYLQSVHRRLSDCCFSLFDSFKQTFGVRSVFSRFSTSFSNLSVDRQPIDNSLA